MTTVDAKHLGDTFMNGVVTSAPLSEVHMLTAIGRELYRGHVPTTEPNVAYYIKAGHHRLGTPPCGLCAETSARATQEQDIDLATQ